MKIEENIVNINIINHLLSLNKIGLSLFLRIEWVDIDVFLVGEGDISLFDPF